MKIRQEKQSGQTVIEVIIAVAIFVIIAGSSVVTILGSLLISKLAEEETQAMGYAVEGIEAAKSIRNQDWDYLTDGDHGLGKAGGFWTFSGTSDENGKFTRIVNVSPVERDGNGDMVDSGGTNDEDTKKITATISWTFTPVKTTTVEVSTYLTNWQLSSE